MLATCSCHVRAGAAPDGAAVGEGVCDAESLAFGIIVRADPSISFRKVVSEPSDLSIAGQLAVIDGSQPRQVCAGGRR